MESKPVKRRLRAKRMLPEIKQMIVWRANQFNSPRDRYKLAEELIAKIQNDYPDEIPPTQETLVHIISKARARNKKSGLLDREFSLSDLDKPKLEMQNISAEAIRHIMRVKRYLASEPNFVGHKLLTIRQARWVARLYATVIENLSMPPGKSTIDLPTIQLWQAAYIYAERELVCEIAEMPFDTSILDKGLQKGMDELRQAYRSQVGTSDWFNAQTRINELEREGGNANGKW